MYLKREDREKFWLSCNPKQLLEIFEYGSRKSALKAAKYLSSHSKAKLSHLEEMKRWGPTDVKELAEQRIEEKRYLV